MPRRTRRYHRIAQNVGLSRRFDPPTQCSNLRPRFRPPPRSVLVGRTPNTSRAGGDRDPKRTTLQSRQCDRSGWAVSATEAIVSTHPRLADIRVTTAAGSSPARPELPDRRACVVGRIRWGLVAASGRIELGRRDQANASPLFEKLFSEATEGPVFVLIAHLVFSR